MPPVTPSTMRDSVVVLSVLASFIAASSKWSMRLIDRQSLHWPHAMTISRWPLDEPLRERPLSLGPAVLADAELSRSCCVWESAPRRRSISLAFVDEASPDLSGMAYALVGVRAARFG